MVNPGNFPISITRGIQYPGQVFRLVDENVVVSGTLSPSVAGTFLLTGDYAGYPLFILAGSPSTFLYYNTAAASYVIARILTNAALTDYWGPASPLLEPTGTYLAHGANTGTATATDNPVNLTGFTAEAVVRRNSNSKVTLDLNPSISSPANGEITIPAITSTGTGNFDFVGTFRWDLVLVSGGERIGPYINGPFTVADNITQ